MTGQSLFYMGESDLAHKVLAIAEEEGATRAAYALKLLQSEGELSIASTGKDNASGRLVTHTYPVNGPAAIFLTTTSIEVDEELLNRCLVLAVDEDREQTRAIHDRQRARARPWKACSPGPSGTEILDAAQQRPAAAGAAVRGEPVRPGPDVRRRRGPARRRDHMKYLALIRAVTLLHQHQRQIRTAALPGSDGRTVRYVEVTKADVALANRLAARGAGPHRGGPAHRHPAAPGRPDPLGRRPREPSGGCDIELVRFTRRQVREALGFGDTQLKVHLARLVDLELVVPHRLDGGGFTYELAWTRQPAAGRPRTGRLRPPAGRVPMGGRSGSGERAVGPGRGLVGVPVGPRPGTRNPCPARETGADACRRPAEHGSRW